MTDLFDSSELEVLADCAQLALDVDAMLERMRRGGHIMTDREPMDGTHRAIIRELADRARRAAATQQLHDSFTAPPTDTWTPVTGADDAPRDVQAMAESLAGIYGRSHIERTEGGYVVQGLTDDVVRAIRGFDDEGNLYHSEEV